MTMAVPLIKRILFPTDLSGNARHAFGYGATIAHRCGAVITVLHVLEDLPPNASLILDAALGREGWERQRKKNEERVISDIRRRVKEFCEGVQQQIPECPFIVENTIIETGHPVEKILEQLNSGQYDMVIMGSRGLGRFKGAIMGSTAQSVLRHCPQPLLLIPPPKKE